MTGTFSVRRCTNIDPKAGDADLRIKIWEELQLFLDVDRNIGGSGACQEEVYAALQFAASFHCLVEEWKDCEVLKPKPKEKWIIVDTKREESKHRTKWCAETNKCRCMRCGRGSKYMKVPGKRTGPKYQKFEKMEKVTPRRPRFGKKNEQGRSGSHLVQKMLGLCEAEKGPKLSMARF